MQWNEFGRAAPEIAVSAEKRIRDDGFCFLGTIKRDGTPRISPVEATFAGGRLVFGMPHKSLKAIDLKRDPRCSIHSAVTTKDNMYGDFKISGVVDEIWDKSFYQILADMAVKEFGHSLPFGAAFYVTIDIKSVSFVDAPKRQVLVWDEESGLKEKRTADIGD